MFVVITPGLMGVPSCGNFIPTLCLPDLHLQPSWVELS